MRFLKIVIDKDVQIKVFFNHINADGDPVFTGSSAVYGSDPQPADRCLCLWRGVSLQSDDRLYAGLECAGPFRA